MKKTILILISLIALVSCKKEASQQESKFVPATPVEKESIVELEGEFYYDDEAAVFKGKNFIYGVKRDLMAEELAKRSTPKKRNSYDMIPVTVKAVVELNPAFVDGEDVWKELVVIKEIIEISDPTDEEIIKIESGSE